MTDKTSASEDWADRYNVQNRLVRVEEDDLLIAEYGYDPFGRRLWKEVMANARTSYTLMRG